MFPGCPPDLTIHMPFFFAGVTMKLMDEVAGIVAARHCKTNIVTASVDAINFHDKIRKGKRPLPMRMRGSGSLGSQGPWCHFALCSHLVFACAQGAGDKTLLCPLHTSARLLFIDLTSLGNSGMRRLLFLTLCINSSS